MTSCRAAQAEVVQPRKLPDGLIEVFYRGRRQPDRVVVEIATRAERRVESQAFGDMGLVLLEYGVLPDVIVIVLRPKGRYRVASSTTAKSRHGLSELTGKWNVVELWTVPAETLLEADDVGLIPWVPLTDFEGPPENVLRTCRERIEQQAPAREQADLLAVTQVFTRLRFDQRNLLTILGGQKVMNESPLIRELVAEKLHRAILAVLRRRFREVPLELSNRLEAIHKEDDLIDLVAEASEIPSLDAFQEVLLSR